MRKRNIQFTIRLTPEESQLLEHKVKKTQLPRETYIRSLISGYVPKEAPPLDYYELMKELRAIGNRMNQIAVKANAIGFIHTDEYNKNTDRLWRALLEIRAAVVLPEKMSV